MSARVTQLAILAVSLGMVVAVIGIGEFVSRAWQSTPNYQFTAARRRWEDHPYPHYRLAANYGDNWAQCYYDIEVRNERIVRTFSFTCLSSAATQTYTVSATFENFERFVTQRVCSPNGCYCEGTYVVHATYDSLRGYPLSITTEFDRNWADDLVHGKYRVQTCLRTDPVVEKIDVVKLIPLP